MFPNVRLMIAAVVASVVVLSCGFGLFATFRVSHEPLSRLASGAPPMQLAADTAAPAGGTAEPFGIRFQMMQTQLAGVAAPPPLPKPEPKLEPKPEPMLEPKPDDHADDDAAPSTVAAPLVAPVAASMAATDAATNATEPEQSAPAVQASATEPDAKPDDAKPDDVTTARIEAPLAATDTAAGEQPAETAAASAPPAEHAAEQAGGQTPPGGSVKEEVKPAAAAPPAVATAPKPHRTVRRTRLAAQPRAGRARAAAPADGQASGIGGPFVPAPSR
jgi:hypothetical protein